MYRRALSRLAHYSLPKDFDAHRLFGYNKVLLRVFTADPKDLAIIVENPYERRTDAATSHSYGDLQRDVLLIANAMFDMRVKAEATMGQERFKSALWQSPRSAPSSIFRGPPRGTPNYTQGGQNVDHGGYNNVILCKPGYEYVCALLASWAMDLMAVPLCHTHHFNSEMAHVFRDSKATTMCVDHHLFHSALPPGVFDPLLHRSIQYEEGGVRINAGNEVLSVSDAPFNIQGVLEVSSLLRDANEQLLPEVMGKSVTVEYDDSLSFFEELKRRNAEQARRVVDKDGNLVDDPDAWQNVSEKKTRVDTELVHGDRAVEVKLNDFLKLRMEGSLPPPSPFDDALMIYTSGTTAKPKGVVHTHESVSNQVQVLLDAWKWDCSDRILNVLPLHHVHGLVNILLCSLAASATCVFSPFVGASQLAARLRKHDLTLFMGVPAIYAKLAQHLRDDLSVVEKRSCLRDMTSLRLLVSGSAALPIPLLETVKELTGHTLLERYGMTEIGMALSQPLRPVDGRLPGSVGSLLPTVRGLVLDAPVGEETTTTTTTTASETRQERIFEKVGPLVVNSPSLFDRYWGNPSATLKELHVDEATGDRYFSTGDTVGLKKVILSDRSTQESFSILGRSSVDIIKHNGYKLSALEIEALLLGTGLIQEVAVVGTPDDVAGELVVAIIVPLTRDTDEKRVEMEVKEAAKQQMTHYKRPSRYIVLPDGLPRNAMGKVNKKALKAELGLA